MVNSYLNQFTDGGRLKAAQLQEELCNQGRGKYCVGLGMALAGGFGVPVDRERAVLLFEEHCGADPEGCSEYGNMFAAGGGVETDLGLARLLLGEACDYKDAQACSELETLLDNTCQGGFGPSCNELGARRAKDGRMDEARALFSRACELEDANGCANRDKTGG